MKASSPTSLHHQINVPYKLQIIRFYIKKSTACPLLKLKHNILYTSRENKHKVHNVCIKYSKIRQKTAIYAHCVDKIVEENEFSSGFRNVY